MMNLVIYSAASAANLMPTVMLRIPPDPVSEAERRVLVLGQPRASNLQPKVISATYHLLHLKKSWGDGRVATVTGVGWRWESLVTDLHSGGQGVMVVLYLPRQK